MDSALEHNTNLPEQNKTTVWELNKSICLPAAAPGVVEELCRTEREEPPPHYSFCEDTQNWTLVCWRLKKKPHESCKWSLLHWILPGFGRGLLSSTKSCLTIKFSRSMYNWKKKKEQIEDKYPPINHKVKACCNHNVEYWISLVYQCDHMTFILSQQPYWVNSQQPLFLKIQLKK